MFVYRVILYFKWLFGSIFLSLTYLKFKVTNSTALMLYTTQHDICKLCTGNVHFLIMFMLYCLPLIAKK